MAFGVICSCCGEKREVESVDDVLLTCQACDDGTAKPEPPDLSIHTIPSDTPVVCLEAAKAFAGLTAKEQAYAYHLSRADWEGAKICLIQTSPESVPIFALFQLVFSCQPVKDMVTAAKAKGVTDKEADQALMYAAAVYGNVGNYKSFGDQKFVPALPPSRFRIFLSASAADAAKVDSLWNKCVARMYSLPSRQRQLGLGAAKGISTYFSANCEEADADLAGRFLESLGLSPYNTRLFKAADGSYTVLLASAVTSGANGDADDAVGALCRKHSFQGKSFTIRRGDYAPLMGRVTAALSGALPHADNEEQRSMLERYIESFEKGSIEAHKAASRHWIKDKGPAVESYIGFIESYRDPSGARGEWEGFVACVNREVSRKFQALVDGAETMLALMPWPRAFEKDVFLRPDFTSLEILAFGSSGVPAGINIPNYDDIRQSEGFKNVSLGNVLAASYGAGDKPISFIAESDQALFKQYKSESFEVQVGIHELLGHGSGKLYHQNTDDAARLVASGMKHPITGAPITGPFYAPGATWDSTFTSTASPYEECRAECAGIYLCLEPAVLSIFGFPDATADAVHDVSYINWLLMAHAGLKALEFYTPETKAWRQAHMRARFVILGVFLEAGSGLVQLAEKLGTDGKPDLEVHLDRSKILSVGRPAIGKFLLALQTYKSLGDLAGGLALFDKYSAVSDKMLEIRAIVMARKEPRKLLVQPLLRQDAASSTVELVEFEASTVGMIESFVARFPADDPELLALYEADLPHVAD